MGKIPMNISVPRKGRPVAQEAPAKVKTKPKVEEYDRWSCPADGVSGLSFKQIMAHLEERHGIVAEGTECTRRLMMHADGRDFFFNKEEVTIAGVVLINERKQSRSAKSRMWRD